jgi:protein associated with RNAse G/E
MGCGAGTDAGMSDFTVYKCDHEGRVVWQYSGTVLERGADWVCLTAVFNGRESDMGLITFRRGDVFTEWFYADRWYNVFRIADGQTGALKGWYCNITRPAQIAADSVRADDLALDVFVTPDGQVLLLDEDEFAALNLAADEQAAAMHAVETLRDLAGRCAEPFDELKC